jgi:hypothetical protein
MAEEIILAKLSKEKEDTLKTYLKGRIHELENGMRVLYEDKIIKWRAAYEARPHEETRQFPFQNASNIVIPIIAIHTDTLKAQLMSAIFKTHPIVTALILGEFGAESDALKEAYSDYMQYVGIDPSELDLYRVYNEGMGECIKFGTVTYKCPWEKKTRHFLIPGGDGTGTSEDFLERTVYEGPRPEKLPFDSFYLPPQAKTIEQADIKCHKKMMLSYELEERGFSGLYDKERVQSVLQSPDRTTPTQVTKEQEENLGARTDSSFGHREYDVWECYVQWRYKEEAFAPRMIVTYHPNSDTILRTAWDNFEPEWFVGARLIQRDDMYHGYGFAEIVWPFQEGASETYNGYRDNQTVANTRVWRVSPDSKLHQGYRIYPSAMLPAEKDEIEPMAHGELSPVALDELRVLLDLAERRSGVSPPQQGFGAGTQSGKRGIYSAMGTLSVLQEGNSRKDLSVSDMRDSHVRLMRLVSRQYGIFGRTSKFHESRLALFGTKAALIKDALDKIVNRQIGLPCYSATASVNKEVEKQNDIMLVQLMDRHYQMIAQLLTAVNNPQAPPAAKQYFIEVMVAAGLLHKKILKNFGHEEVSRLVPDPIKALQAQAKQQEQAQKQQQQPQGGQPNGQPQPQPQGSPPNEVGGGAPMAPGTGGSTIQ